MIAGNSDEDNPDEDAVKAVLAQIEPATLLAVTAWDAWPVARACCVTWSRVALSGESYQLHKLSLLDAFALALAFCGTRASREWIICGQNVFAILRTLAPFKQDEAAECHACPLVYVGKIGQITVFLAPKHHPDNFCAGIFGGGAEAACRGEMILD